MEVLGLTRISGPRREDAARGERREDERIPFALHAIKLLRRVAQHVDREAVRVQGMDAVHPVEEPLREVRDDDEIDVAPLMHAPGGEGAVKDHKASREFLDQPLDQGFEPPADLRQAVKIDRADAKHV